MGVVYRAKQLSLKRTVAIKILRPELAANRSFTERFHREAQIAAQISSNRIVQAIDTGCSHGQYYFVMEYVKGSTVQDLLDQGKTFDEKNTLEIGVPKRWTMQINRDWYIATLNRTTLSSPNKGLQKSQTWDSHGQPRKMRDGLK